MLTGVEINRRIQQFAGFEYSRYYDRDKMNRYLNKALTDIVWQKVQYYRQGQKEAEDLQPLIVYARQFSVLNNRVSLRDMIISQVNYSGLSVVLTVANAFHNLQTGDTISLSGVLGVTGLDPAVTITGTGTTTISFINSIIPIGSYTANSGTISSDRFCNDYWYWLGGKCNFPSAGYNNFVVANDPINSMGRFFDQPTARKPCFEEAGNFLYIKPLNVNCTTLELYYVRKPQYDIDVDNTTIDYSLWLNEKMLGHLEDTVVRNWKAAIGDTEGMQREQQLIIDNP